MQKKLILLTLFLSFFVITFGKGKFIKVINNNSGYFIEIEDSLLGRDILFGSRIVDLSSPSAKVYAAGQMRTPPTMIRFVRKDNMLLMQEIVNIVNLSVDDPIYGAAIRNMKVGSVQVFDIKTRKESSSVIDVTKYFSDEVAIAWPLPDNVKKGKLETKLSSIESMKEYPDHFNVRSHYEFTGGKEPFTITVQYFMLLLSKEPARLRLADERVGYQSVSMDNYSSGKSIEKSKYISRWRLEVKPEDINRFKAGELVEPIKPIVVYVEPYFPKEWIKYIKQGVEDWQEAFEAIGFKNAILAKEFPKDSEFDPEDISVSIIRYIPVKEANAAGQIWTDPRSGEIIQGDVLWWNDVIDLIKMWRFTQTAAVDSTARAINYSEKIMGESVRYAIAHEVGHMLGLQHNMRSSYSYPVDSLRSPTFTQKYGTTASIMDYARNNHVAQVGDLERGVKMTPPNIGPFDIMAIEYGYKPIYGAVSPIDELPMLDSIFTAKGSDPKYKFAPFITAAISPDPSAQSESLGDDVVKSSELGLVNARIILKNLKEWTLSAGGGTGDITKRYEALIKQYFRFISSTISYIGGVYEMQGPCDNFSGKYLPVSRGKQREALTFAIKELMEAPLYLDIKELITRIGSQNDLILKRQADVVSSLMGNFILPRILSSQCMGEDNYTLKEYLKDIDKLILIENSGLSLYDRNLHISYIQSLKKVAQIPVIGEESSSGGVSLISEAAFNQLNKTKKWLKTRAKGDGQLENHYKFLLQIIDK